MIELQIPSGPISIQPVDGEKSTGIWPNVKSGQSSAGKSSTASAPQPKAASTPTATASRNTGTPVNRSAVPVNRQQRRAAKAQGKAAPTSGGRNAFMRSFGKRL